jgi:predicted transcriptional regulator
VVIRPRMIELSRKFGKIDVELYYDDHLVCKAMLTAQMIDQV